MNECVNERKRLKINGEMVKALFKVRNKSAMFTITVFIRRSTESLHKLRNMVKY